MKQGTAAIFEVLYYISKKPFALLAAIAIIIIIDFAQKETFLCHTYAVQTGRPCKDL